MRRPWKSNGNGNGSNLDDKIVDSTRPKNDHWKDYILVSGVFGLLTFFYNFLASDPQVTVLDNSTAQVYYDYTLWTGQYYTVEIETVQTDYRRASRTIAQYQRNNDVNALLPDDLDLKNGYDGLTIYLTKDNDTIFGKDLELITNRLNCDESIIPADGNIRIITKITRGRAIPEGRTRITLNDGEYSACSQ